MSAKLLPQILQPDRLILIIFVYGSYFFSGQNQQQLIGVALAGITAFVFLLGKYNERWTREDIPNELIFFGVWLLWAFLTGLFTANVQWFFRQQIFRLAQIYVLIICFFVLLKVRPTFHYIFISFVIVALAQGYMSQTGLMAIVDETLAGSASIEDVRAGGVGNATNPNGLATLMVLGCLSAVFFWRGPHKVGLFRRGLILAFIAFACFVILRSGSRKGVVYFGIFAVGWGAWVLPISRGIGGWLVRILLLIVALSLLVFIAPILLEGTAAGARWAEFLGRGDNLEGMMENEVRYWLFRDGLRMVGQHPIAGVGHAHFRIHSFNGLTSHSDIIEPLANTGIVGFILYQSFYVVTFLRLRKLLRIPMEPLDAYHVKLMTLISVYFLIYGLGFFKYQSQPVMVAIVTVITYSHFLQLKYQRVIRSHYPVHRQRKRHV